MFFNPFRSRNPPENAWFPVGRASSFPEVGVDKAEEQPNLCSLIKKHRAAGPEDPSAPVPQPAPCKVFHVPRTDPVQRTELSLPIHEGEQDLTDQVLVFRYRGKIHAIDHQCPHSSFPLSQGVPFDIEDFGIALSAGLTCPKHGWSFDLFSGRADRGNYRLKVWEVELRDIAGAEGEANEDREVWVRRKPRVG
ncbi:hypothetical protein VTJ83DRAFT_1846 [Remersonia thermophila]|uniref:Rieske domain-containing protein n=1 Tax=Remersonia thermophila TaxID=72144 RepID=A0ABR4DH26_9PEZI